MAKAVLISIRPGWVEKIANELKTIEVRKSKPNLETPFKCYIYCTNTRPFLVWGHVFRGDWFTEFTHLSGYSRAEADEIWNVFNGHVAGEFTCDRVEIIKATTEPYGTYDVDDDFVAQTGLVNGALWDYGKGATLYGWHISELKVYDAPKPLSEFWFPDDLYCEKELCGGCPWDQSPDINGEYEFDCGWRRPLRRPPQSWCYVEELGSE